MQSAVDGQPVASWSDPSRDSSSFTQCRGSQLPAQLDTSRYPNGSHSLGYSATNAAGVPSSNTRTISVDNAPVGLNLTGPSDAPSTAGTQHVDAYTHAGPSGVAGITCSVDGSPYQWHGGSAATIPVGGVGQHRVDCYAVNRAVDASGSPARSPSQTWTLSIRDTTVAAISFTKVVDALSCHRVRERAKVPGRWVTVRRHHERVQLRRGGHWRTILVTRCHPRTAWRREVIWKTVHRHGKTVKIKQIKVVRVVVLPHVVGHNSRRVPFGRRATVSGWLGLYNGTALSGQSVRILAAPDNGSNDFQQVALVRTRADGGWSAELPRGPGRLVEVAYNGSPTSEPAHSTAVRLIVTAKVRLSIPLLTRAGAARSRSAAAF